MLRTSVIGCPPLPRPQNTLWCEPQRNGIKGKEILDKKALLGFNGHKIVAMCSIVSNGEMDGFGNRKF